MRVIVTGSRDWENEQAIRLAFALVTQLHGSDLTVIHGACPWGADAIADDVASGWGGGMQVERHPAAWRIHGKAAGFIRNKEMVDLGADLVLAFQKNKSKGTQHTIDLARKAGIEVRVMEE